MAIELSKQPGPHAPANPVAPSGPAVHMGMSPPKKQDESVPPPPLIPIDDEDAKEDVNPLYPSLPKLPSGIYGGAPAPK